MGPINDELGVEQGGVSSSDLYQSQNNEQLSVPQETKFGINFTNSDDVHVASIGQADDTVLASNDLVKLKFLFKLTMNFWNKYKDNEALLQCKICNGGQMDDEQHVILCPALIHNQNTNFHYFSIGLL